MTKDLSPCLGLTLLLALPPASAPAFFPGSEDEARYREHVEELASDELAGRGLGSAGLEKAAEYIEAQLSAAGVAALDAGEPAARTFALTTSIALSDQGNWLQLDAPGQRERVEVGQGQMPFGTSASGSFAGPVVFAGYALHAPELGYDDFVDLDLEGSVVVAFRYEPQEDDAGSPLRGKRALPASAPWFKAAEVQRRGGQALLLVDPRSPDRLPRLRPAESNAAIPVLALSHESAQRWLAGAGVDLAQERARIDAELRSTARPLSGLRARGEVRLAPERAACRNLIYALPGAGSLAAQWLILSAHYDHLGRGGSRSMVPGSELIHNGADDNASGVAALLVAAPHLRAALEALPNRRSVALIFFSAEEEGQAGSHHYVQHSALPLEQTVGLLNLDMVGRLRDSQLYVFGATSAPQWQEWLSPEAQELDLAIQLSGLGYGASDQTPFLARGIPALHFFTGVHPDYHSPDDDADKINVRGGARIAALAAGLITRAAGAEQSPAAVAMDLPPTQGGDHRGSRASLGTIPDYASIGESSGGVKISGVREGSPADLAGLRGGDRIVAMEGEKIHNLRDLSEFLKEHNPGDNLPVVVERRGEERVFAVTLGQRAERSPQSSAAEKQDEGPRSSDHQPSEHRPAPMVHDAEVHLRNIRQLTFGGENAEAYFSPDNRQLVFQATTRAEKAAGGCDKIYVYDLQSGQTRLFSSGAGRTTCAYFSYPEGDQIIYASTHGGSAACPPVPDHSQGYVWPLYASYELYIGPADGSSAPTLLASAPGYDAEATWCHQGGRIVFTSTRDGDIELYSMAEDGSDLQRLTHAPGYDGGAFYSPDCSKIVWRASRPRGEALADYRRLLAAELVRPGQLEIYVMDADGSNVIQLTDDGAANFGPFFHPSGRKVIYSTNRGSASGREFDLFMVGLEGGEPERITHAEDFDGFPMFSGDGRYLVWGSNRNNELRGETNLFLAEWVEGERP